MKCSRGFAISLLGVLAGLMLGGDFSLAAGDLNAAGPAKHVEPCPGRGWRWIQRRDEVQPDCGKRSPVFYVGEPVAFTLGPSARTYEVRNYWGELVDQGAAGKSVTLNVKLPGWYKLYVYGKVADLKTEPLEPDTKPVKLPKGPKDDAVTGVLHSGLPHSERPATGGDLSGVDDLSAVIEKEEAPPPRTQTLWGDVVGCMMFVIFRNILNFPPLPAKGVYPEAGTGDQVMRGVTGMGPQRHQAAADKPDESIAALEPEIAVDRALYLPFDPVRKRALMIAFGGGTREMEEGVRTVATHFKDSVRYYEPRNEPNYGSGGKDFLEREMKPFYKAVKGVDPGLKVMGPGTVSINPSQLPFIEEFLKAGGGDYIDAFSFHCYNGVNGDLALGRRALGNLTALLKKCGAEKKELWQTEQGYAAAIYGVYRPRLQGRWTMLEMMLFEQYGLPREHNHLWYDRSHGYWSVPTWWENGDGSFNPGVVLMRVLAEEQFGLTFSRALDFGEPGNRIYLGNLFESPDKTRAMAAFMSAGSTDGKVPLKVKGGDSIHVVSAFGVEQDLPVRDGSVTLPVPELPVYVELAKGQTIEVVPTDWGRNLARDPGETAFLSHPPIPPKDPKNRKEVAAFEHNSVQKIINGELDTWYYAFSDAERPWSDTSTEFPNWVGVSLPAPTKIARVVIYAAVPWQCQGTLLDYELQYASGDQWVTIERVTEPTRTIRVFTPATRTVVDTFFSDRCIFQHEFKPVTTEKIRLLVHDATYGGGATKAESDAGGQCGPHQVVLREVEIYGK